VRLLVDIIKRCPDRLQEFLSVIRGPGQFSKMMFQVIDTLSPSRKRCGGQPNDVDLVLQVGQKARLLFVAPSQLERHAQQWRYE